MYGCVKGIEGRSAEGRREFIKQQLSLLGVRYSTMEYDTVMGRGVRHVPIHGENIVVTFAGTSNRTVVIGAHSDAVEHSPGANDDGSGVAVLLELVRTLKSEKLRHTFICCFFDEEEDGLIGSAEFVHRYLAKDHLAMINLDIEGTGNEVYVGPVGGGDDDLIMKYIHAARASTHYAYEENEAYPGSDYASFASAGLENIAISVVPKGDVEKLVKWTNSGFAPILRPEDMPEVLKVMHSPHDSSTYVSPSALTMSYEFTKATLHYLDDGEP